MKDMTLTRHTSCFPPLADIKDSVALLESSVSLLEPRLCTRVLRALPSIRSRLDGPALAALLKQYYPQGESPLLASLLRHET